MTRLDILYLVPAALVWGSALAQGNGSSGCADPLAAILATLDCVEQENATCASQGYNAAMFRKLHNGLDTNTTIDEGGDFWTGAFVLVDIGLDYNHMANLGNNQVSLRFVEVVNTTTGVEVGLDPCNEYPWGTTFYQYEHALVTVDDDCKMILWDQYGDNKEQAAVDEAVALILSDPAMLCLQGILPEEKCAEIDGIDCGGSQVEQDIENMVQEEASEDATSYDVECPGLDSKTAGGSNKDKPMSTSDALPVSFVVSFWLTIVGGWFINTQH